MYIEISTIFFLVCVVISKILSTKALKYLSDEQKLSLMKSFEGMRAYGLIPLVLIMGGYYALLQVDVISIQILGISYFIALFVYIFVWLFLVHKKCKKLDLPSAYIREHSLSIAILYLGLGVSLAIGMQSFI